MVISKVPDNAVTIAQEDTVDPGLYNVGDAVTDEVRVVQANGILVYL